jgi:plasmid stability protein
LLLRKGAAVHDILVRGLDAETVERLKARASRHGRSLQSELKALVERAAGVGGEQVAEVLQRWEERFAGRRFSSSARLIREDRGR